MGQTEDRHCNCSAAIQTVDQIVNSCPLPIICRMTGGSSKVNNEARDND